MSEPYYLFFDTETNAKTNRYGMWTNKQHIIELGYYVTDKNLNILKKKVALIKDIAKKIYPKQEVYTLNDLQKGESWNGVFDEFLDDIKTVNRAVAHNLEFDKTVIIFSSKKMVSSEKIQLFEDIINKIGICSMKTTTKFCKLSKTGNGAKYGGYKWPSLKELYEKLYGVSPEQSHKALDDVELLYQCYRKYQDLPRQANIFQ